MKTKIQNLIIALVWLAVPALVQAQFTFTTNNGAITITGYNPAAGLNAVIPAATNGYPVTSIGDYAFESGGITKVTIPNSVTNIGNQAFAYCTSLTNIAVATANPAYSSLGGVLFDKAQVTLLQFPGGLGGSYTVPNGVTSIGDYAFITCPSLASVTIGTNVTSIGDSAFEACTILASVMIPNSVTSIGDSAFQNCPSLTSVTIGTNVTSIGDRAFEYCTSLPSVTIPNSVTSIGDSAFYYCPSLTSVTIGTNVASIGDYAFESCSLTSVTIPNSVTNIGVSPFASCTSLTAITLAAQNPAYSTVNGVLFDKSQATLLEFPGGLGGSYTIPGSVTSIGEAAFEFCSSLTGVTIPNSVTNVGDYAFGLCSSLTSVMIPNSVTSIGYDAFDFCSGLTSVTIPNSVTSIGDYAFEFCSGLASAYFLGNAPPDYGYAFYGDPATVYYLAGTTGWGSTFGSVPAVLWNPQANTFSFTGGQFGFNLTGPANAVIVVEACTNLTQPVWLPVSTNTLSGLGTSAFSDPTGYPMRYYRFRSP